MTPAADIRFGLFCDVRLDGRRDRLATMSCRTFLNVQLPRPKGVSMFDHVSVVVSDYAKSKAFYSQALAPTGHSRLTELRATSTGQKRVPASAMRMDPIFGSAKAMRSHPPIHIAFRVSSRAAVDAFYKAAIAAGGRDNGAPGLRPHYHANYYGAFVLDPDGHNIEAVCHEAE